jgi:hypothetical protein
MIIVSIGVSAIYTMATGRDLRYSQQDAMLVNALINSALLVILPAAWPGTGCVGMRARVSSPSC